DDHAAIDGFQLAVRLAGGNLDAAVDLADVLRGPGRRHGQQQGQGEGKDAGAGHGASWERSVRAMSPRSVTIRSRLTTLDPPGVPQPGERRRFPGPGRHRPRGAWRWPMLGVLLAVACGVVQAQAEGEPSAAERELRKVRAELQEIG